MRDTKLHASSAKTLFDYTYRLPKETFIVTMGILLIPLLWFASIHHRPEDGDRRAVIVGDDPVSMNDILEITDLSVIGPVSSPTPYRAETFRGGLEVACEGICHQMGNGASRHGKY